MKIMKTNVQITYSAKNIFTSKSNNKDEKQKKNYTITKYQWKPNRGIYLKYFEEYTIKAKMIVKKILVSEYQAKYYGA